MAKSKKPKARSSSKTPAPNAFREALRVDDGFQLREVDPAATPAFGGNRKSAQALQGQLAARIADVQERLYAESQSGGGRSLLLVVQGMDTSGKGGIMRHVIGAMDPQAIKQTAFKAPNEEERRHHFLWRVAKALPAAGEIGVFDRSHYEDVLIARVRELVSRAVWSGRYREINEFEDSIVGSGTTIVKVMLHVSSEEQKRRLARRLQRPDKHWKFHPSDIDERAFWSDYMEAYQAALTMCSTEGAPWFCVPADHKWYARLAVSSLVLDALEVMDPQWPEVDLDVEKELARLNAS